MNEAILWLMLLESMVENKRDNSERKLKTCMHKPVIAMQVKNCIDKKPAYKGYQQAIFNVPRCSFKQSTRSVCA